MRTQDRVFHFKCAESAQGAGSDVPSVSHHDAAQFVRDVIPLCIGGASRGVAHHTLIPFDIEVDPSCELLFGPIERMIRRHDAIARDGQKCPAKRIEVRSGWCVRVRRCLRRRSLLIGAEAARLPLRVPWHPWSSCAGAHDIAGYVDAYFTALESHVPPVRALLLPDTIADRG